MAGSSGSEDEGATHGAQADDEPRVRPLRIDRANCLRADDVAGNGFLLQFGEALV